MNVFPSQIEELILKQSHLAPHYVLEVSREGHLDQLIVKVEADPKTAHERPICDDAGKHLQHNIKSYIGVTALVDVCAPGTIDRSVGKAKRVIDRRVAR